MSGADPVTLPGQADVVVVGGGIAGTSVAYHLAAAGEDVVLLEREEIGGGTTRAAVGVLSPPMRQPFHETARFMGQEDAARVWRFALRSVEGLSGLLGAADAVDEAGLDLRGGHVLAEPHTEHDLRRSFEALAAAGLPVTWLSAAEVRDLTGGRGFTGGSRIEGLGALRPGPTTRLLAEAARERGARAFEGVDVREVHADVDGYAVETSAGTVRATAVVHAAHLSSRRFSGLLEHAVVPIRGQGFVTGPVRPRFPGSFATHWKTNVWRQETDGRLIVSGWRNSAWERSYRAADLRVDEELQGDIERWFELSFPDLGPLEVQERWSGIFGWTSDFLPIAGPLPGPGRDFAVTGFSGGGLPFAFECGRVVAHQVADLPAVEGAELFDPARFEEG